MTSRRGSLLVVFLTVLIDLIGFGIFIPLLPFYAREYDARGLTAGLLVATFSFMQLVFAPILGKLSDRVGRRPVLLIGLLGSAIAYVVFALAQSLWLLFLARALAGTFGATIPTAQAYVADVTTAETRARGMGLIGAAFGIGFVIGPPLGGLLSGLGLAAPGLFAAGLSLAAFLLGLLKLPESIQPGRPSPGSRSFSLAAVAESLTDPRRGILLALFLVATYCFANLESMFQYLGMELQGFGRREMGYVFLLIGLSSALVQGGLIHRLVKQVGERPLFLTATLVLGATFLTVGFAHDRTLYFACCVFIGLFFGVANPTLISLLSKNTPPDRQGGTFGVAQACTSLGRVLGHAGAGLLFDIAPCVPFVVAGVLYLLVSLGGAWYRRRFPTDLLDAARPAPS